MRAMVAESMIARSQSPTLSDIVVLVLGSWMLAYKGIIFICTFLGFKACG